jgi:hypothetical protein
MFREYRLSISLQTIGELGGVPSKVLFNMIFQETDKFCQLIINRLQVEAIDKNDFYEYLSMRELPLSTTTIDMADLQRLITSFTENQHKKFSPPPGTLISAPIDEKNVIKVLTIKNKDGSKLIVLSFLSKDSLLTSFLSFPGRISRLCNPNVENVI